MEEQAVNHSWGDLWHDPGLPDLTTGRKRDSAARHTARSRSDYPKSRPQTSPRAENGTPQIENPPTA
ncbi:hypothetical protein NDU88_004803 [Pleurodeles waltl]|uniref:Uncharacterized protein n=1 Tax=Pleurodeles waltl TaxID=8319 RepID=A0AAV7UGS4_PLEWA|nr:hypothetical protein NDU88_004803 [Pleurodeles waltl]